MAQAHYCVREHRPLFAVVPADDPDPLRLNSAGTRDMVKRLGAFAVHSKDDYPKMLALLSEKLKELPHGELRGQVQLTLPVNRATRA
jgi:hypothetical protein